MFAVFWTLAENKWAVRCQRLSSERAYRQSLQTTKQPTTSIHPDTSIGFVILRVADLDGRRRPETLSITELVRLADVFASVSRRAVL